MIAHEASIAAADQGKFWEMHDKLFENQKDLTRAALERYAEELGLDMAKFRKALDSGSGKARIQEDLELAERVQSAGTPNHYVNGRRLKGAKPFDEFKKVIDEEIAKTSKMLADGVSPEELYPKLVQAGKVFEPLDATVHAIKTDGDVPTKGNPKAGIAIAEFSDFQ
jgi:protein-disulfide isomerase